MDGNALIVVKLYLRKTNLLNLILSVFFINNKNVEIAINMIPFLAIQNTYSHLQIALFYNEQCIDLIQIDKFEASKKCIITLDHLLQKHSLALNDLAFIAANQGPGPFTTLRVAISTINGLSFARKIPLIGIDAIQAFIHEYEKEPYGNKVVLLNAFGKDLYYGIQASSNNYFGCASIPAVLQEISQKTSADSILFLGNGIDFCKQEIESRFSNRVYFLNPNPETVSINQIGLSALAHWKAQKNISYQLQPLYYKAAFIS